MRDLDVHQGWRMFIYHHQNHELGDIKLLHPPFFIPEWMDLQPSGAHAVATEPRMLPLEIASIRAGKPIDQLPTNPLDPIQQ